MSFPMYSGHRNACPSPCIVGTAMHVLPHVCQYLYSYPWVLIQEHSHRLQISYYLYRIFVICFASKISPKSQNPKRTCQPRLLCESLQRCRWPRMHPTSESMHARSLWPKEQCQRTATPELLSPDASVQPRYSSCIVCLFLVRNTKQNRHSAGFHEETVQVTAPTCFVLVSRPLPRSHVGLWPTMLRHLERRPY